MGGAAMSEKRAGRDRRRKARGGRRFDDRQGFSPLVLVIDGEAGRRDVTEIILAKLHFAVAPVDTADRALALMSALRPEVIVSSEADAPRLRQGAPTGRKGHPVPVVAVGDHERDPDVLVERIRAALRAHV
jgi:hypothetical protein